MANEIKQDYNYSAQTGDMLTTLNLTSLEGQLPAREIVTREFLKKP